MLQRYEDHELVLLYLEVPHWFTTSVSRWLFCCQRANIYDSNEQQLPW